MLKKGVLLIAVLPEFLMQIQLPALFFQVVIQTHFSCLGTANKAYVGTSLSMVEYKITKSSENKT